MIIQALKGIPPNERLELVFEQQDRYWPQLDKALRLLISLNVPEMRFPDGRSKLANWRWVPKNSTPFTEPADYLAFALLQAYKDPTSKKSVWCRQILETDGGQGFGLQLTREQARSIVLRAQALHRITLLEG